MADMMERFTNMFRDDPDAGRGRMTDTEGGIKVALGDAIALQRMNGGNVLETFLQSELGDLLYLAERDPAFANILANAVKDYPSVLRMMPSGNRMSDQDLNAVQGAMESSFDEGLTYGDLGGSGRISDRDLDSVRGAMESSFDDGLTYGNDDDLIRGAMESSFDDGLTYGEPMESRRMDRSLGESLMDPSFDKSLIMEPSCGTSLMPAGVGVGVGVGVGAGGTMGLLDQYNKQAEEPEVEGFIGDTPMPRYAGGGYVQEQSRPEEESPRPVRRTLSTALSPTLSRRLFG